MNRRDRREIGATLAKSMPSQHTLLETARELHLSKRRVAQIQQDALWKVYMRMQHGYPPR
jgi:DNA-directed RNA polymerase sigma subunit (sigma70/sigma32)